MAKFKTLEERNKLCEVWQQSGLSKTEFCLLNNLNRGSFYGWLKKLRRKDDNPANKNKDRDLKGKPINKTDTIKFFKMPTTQSSNIREDLCYLEIALPNGISFKVRLLPNNMDKLLIGLLTWK